MALLDCEPKELLLRLVRPLPNPLARFPLHDVLSPVGAAHHQADALRRSEGRHLLQLKTGVESGRLELAANLDAAAQQSLPVGRARAQRAQLLAC